MNAKQLLRDVLKIDAIGIRPAGPDDLGYVIDSFGRSYRPEFPDVRTSEFAAWIRLHIRRLLTEEGTSILVAHDGDAPDVLRGWIAYGPQGRLDYLFVRPDYRGFGIGARLMTAAGFDASREIVATHVTRDARKYTRAHEGRVRFVPLP